MIYTGYFDKLADYCAHGLTPVCIAGYAPQDYTGKRYKYLAPKKTWWQEWHDKNLSNEWYEQKYHQTVLNTLNPHTVASDIQSFGENVIMLCYERPPEFCHRHLVAKWMNAHSIPVREYPLTR